MTNPKPLTRQEKETNAKVMARMEADNEARLREYAEEDRRRKDEQKEAILGRMDEIIPRSERMAITGKSRMFSFPKIYS